MNCFEFRQLKRKQVRKLVLDQKDFAKVLEAVGIQSFFEDAFTALYGKHPKLEHRGGWFYLQEKRISKAELMQRARGLYAKLHEQELGE